MSRLIAHVLMFNAQTFFVPDFVQVMKIHNPRDNHVYRNSNHIIQTEIFQNNGLIQ